MPQQPKITGDALVDSWALQVTQELNNAGTGAGGTRVVANPGGTPPTDLTTITINGVSYSIRATAAARFRASTDGTDLSVNVATNTISYTPGGTPTNFPTNVLVVVNGSLLTPGTDYTVSTDTITFAVHDLIAGDEILIFN